MGSVGSYLFIELLPIQQVRRLIRAERGCSRPGNRESSVMSNESSDVRVPRLASVTSLRGVFVHTVYGTPSFTCRGHGTTVLALCNGKQGQQGAFARHRFRCVVYMHFGKHLCLKRVSFLSLLRK